MGGEDAGPEERAHTGAEREGVAGDGPGRGADETTCPGRSCGKGTGIEEDRSAGETEKEIGEWNGWEQHFFGDWAL